METNELKILWQTLAKEKLITNELAEENIERIISKQSGSIIHKLQQKTKRSGMISALAFVFTLIATIYVQIDIQKLFPTNTYIGIIFIEGYLLLSVLREFSKLTFIKRSYNLDSIKDSLTKIKAYLAKIIKVDLYIGLSFCLCMLIIYIAKYLIDIGGINQIRFSGNKLFVHSPYFVMVIVLLLLLSPIWIRKEIKMKFSKLQTEIDNSLKELEEL